MKNKTCCVTGHRNVPSEKEGQLYDLLRKEILQAISDGYTHFISGFAEGVDLLFASIVSEFKPQYALTLEAAIPYPNRLKTVNAMFQKFITHCDVVIVHSGEYGSSCYMKRNRYMVEQSGRVIAVYDGRSNGGTFATMQYAHELKKELKLIKIYRKV